MIGRPLKEEHAFNVTQSHFSPPNVFQISTNTHTHTHKARERYRFNHHLMRLIMRALGLSVPRRRTTDEKGSYMRCDVVDEFTEFKDMLRNCVSDIRINVTVSVYVFRSSNGFSNEFKSNRSRQRHFLLSVLRTVCFPFDLLRL